MLRVKMENVESRNCGIVSGDIAGEKVFLYPKHLKMVGRYNSLFALDESAVSGMADTEGWKEKRLIES